MTRALTVGVSLPKLVGEIKSAWRELQKTERSADVLYQEIGAMLSKARAQVLVEKKETWTAFMERNFSDLGIRRSRAYELMAVADKKTTVAKVRERKSISMRKTREKRPPRGGQQAGAKLAEAAAGGAAAEGEAELAERLAREAGCDSVEEYNATVVLKLADGAWRARGASGGKNVSGVYQQASVATAGGV